MAGRVFRCLIPVRWGDLDALVHVNNTVYFRYFEEARVQLFERAGMSLPADRVGVLAHASCDFLRPLHYPCTVVVNLEVARIGRSSLELNVSIEVEGQPGVVYAKGRNVMVSTDGNTGKSSPWAPDELVRLAACFS
jgi:acyl-CoA thioester hydrolase